MRNNLRKRLISLALLLGLSGSAFAQSLSLPLVAEIDFSATGKENARYVSIDEVDGIGNSILPAKLETDIPLLDTVFSTDKTSSFLDSKRPCYAITPNPIKLDTFRLFDNGDSGEWGFIVSGGGRGTSLTQKVLSYSLKGLKNNGKYRVEVEYCNPHSASYLDPSGNNKQPHLNVQWQGILRIGINTTAAEGTFTSSPSSKEGQCSIVTINAPTQASTLLNSITNGNLTINIATDLFSQQAIMIKNIKVYAEVEPTISGKEEVCIGGESSVLSADNSFRNCSIQWYKDGEKIEGATSSKYIHTSAAETRQTKYHYIVTTPNGDQLSSETFTVNDIACCLTDEGEPAFHKLIWQEDFGTFTSATEYWSWDYSELNAPKKVFHNDGTKWTTCYGLEIPMTICSKPFSGEGWFTVAGNVTCSYDAASDGTQWEWQAYCPNGKSPRENGLSFVPDHTYKGKAYGGMLYVNAGYDSMSVIYSKKISNMTEKNVTANCFINNFLPGGEPAKIFMRLTDTKNGLYYTSDTITCETSRTNSDWYKASVKAHLEGDEVLLEIVSAVGGIQYNERGNDFVLDDIQLYVCDEKPEGITLDGYAPKLMGDTIRCSYDTTIYQLSEKAPHGCEYYWRYDDKPVEKGEDFFIIPAESSEEWSPYKHHLECLIVSATADSLTVSCDFRTIVPDLFLVEEIQMDKIKFQAMVASTNDLDTFHWMLNGHKLYDTTADAITLSYNDVNEGSILVYATNQNGCQTEMDSRDFKLSPYCVDEKDSIQKKSLVWQDDFGEFWPTTDSTGWFFYQVWDYSNMEAPVRVTKKSETPFRYALENAPLNYQFSTQGAVQEGEYTVAGALTSYESTEFKYDPSAIILNDSLRSYRFYDESKYASFKLTGALLEWSGDVLGYKRNSGEIAYDHSQKIEGCALFVNAKAEDYGKAIYSRTISGLQSNRNYECNVFFTLSTCVSNEFATPADLKLRISDVSNPAAVEVSGKALSIGDGGSGQWQLLSAELFLEKSNDLLIEVINNSENRLGSNIVIDDIRLFTCEGHEETNLITTVAQEENDIVNVYTVSGIQVKANVKKSQALDGLQKGTYIVGHEKVMIKK
ncbi:MAG: hypothetical protein J6Y37_15570 [Paludibacteraceae bacterium]|nr:hypothetical protein [Paludibacteraceae bacterium]